MSEFLPLLARPTRLLPGLLVAGMMLSGPASAQEAAKRNGTWVDPPTKDADPGHKPVSPIVPDGTVAARPVDARPELRSAAGPAQVQRKTHAPAPGVAGAFGRPAHREAAMPAVSPATLPVTSGGLAEVARRTTTDYLAAVSSNVASTGRFYGDRVHFHGRVMTRGALAVEKARFARRWPERRYEPRGEARTHCDITQAVCRVTTAFDFKTSSTLRGARSAGIGELTVVISFTGERPTILSESSRVLRRGASAPGAGGRAGGADRSHT